MQNDDLFDYRQKLAVAFARETEWSVADRERQRYAQHVEPEMSWEELAQLIADERAGPVPE
ncbi:MAG TPA: hypothetical protein VHL31_21135 [Geminicoccus sp.]|jgi:hypothetical protein|uniref:hypothetical protein n=1 Tax=Geminicoccus sp. TaxID=2024832 RepID=UPI002E335017|nr:hypothetical protein [Geminicoccus sp.]HEX2528783.1 hypothetical protein [Geminicoccus sp.]